jgi:hypothetical protein
MVAGCSGGDDAASAHGGPVTIVTDIDVTTGKGTFRVRKGSEELGCSGGTFVNYALGEASGPGESSDAILKVLTCSDGERSGSFRITFELAFSRWNFRSGTGDFAGVKGKGKFAWRRSPGSELSGVETLTGTVRS